MTPNVLAPILSSVASALVIAMAFGFFRITVRSFRSYIEKTIAPANGENLYSQINEVRDLSARAVVLASRAEACAKRTEEKMNLLLLSNDPNRRSDS